MTIRRWVKIGAGLGIGVVSLISFFTLLTVLYNFEIVDLTGDIECEGTYENPCLSEFDIKNPNPYVVDIYSKDQVKLDFSPDIYDYGLFVKDGRCGATGKCACELKDGRFIGFKGWRCVDFTNKTKPRVDRVYNFRFPAYTTKHFMLAGIKNQPSDIIKWGIGVKDLDYLDPVWRGFPSGASSGLALAGCSNFSENVLINNGTSQTLGCSDDLLNNITVYNQTWLDFDGDNDYIYIDLNYLKNNDSYLLIPTYDGANQSVHPDIYYNSTGWNGYNYWMVFTPYANSDASLENPSILASDDSLNWEVPSGLTNPINSSSPASFYSDTDLVYKDGYLYVYYRENNASSSTFLLVQNSSDGVNWSESQTVLIVLNSSEFVSPSIVYNSNKSLFEMWVVNLTSSSIDFYNSSDGVNWSESYETDFSFLNNIWHMNINWIEGLNEYWLIYNDLDKTVFLFGNSSNGINWTLWSKPLIQRTLSSWDDGVIYRGSMLYNEVSKELKLYYSAQNQSGGEWNIGYTSKNVFEKNDLNDFLDFRELDKNYSISVWINRTSSVNKFIFDRRSADNNGWNIRIVNNVVWCQYGYSDLKSEFEILEDEWYHVVCSIGKSSNANSFIYVNGVVNGSLNITETTKNMCSPYVGTQSYGVAGEWNGCLDDLRIYNVSLNSSQILEIYNSGRSSTNVSDNIVLHLKLNENSGTIVYDVSGNSNDGTITGATWNNDGIKVLLTRNTDYTLIGNVLTLINSDYSWSQLMTNFREVVNKIIFGGNSKLIIKN